MKIRCSGINTDGTRCGNQFYDNRRTLCHLHENEKNKTTLYSLQKIKGSKLYGFPFELVDKIQKHAKADTFTIKGIEYEYPPENLIRKYLYNKVERSLQDQIDVIFLSESLLKERFKNYIIKSQILSDEINKNMPEYKTILQKRCWI